MQAVPGAPGTPEYRDRAEERRQAFGDNDANTRQRAPEQEEEDETPLQTTSIGASLLNRMGWTEGSGLGAQGTGVTEPIPTEAYAQGVGLGAPGTSAIIQFRDVLRDSGPLDDARERQS